MAVGIENPKEFDIPWGFCLLLKMWERNIPIMKCSHYLAEADLSKKSETS